MTMGGGANTVTNRVHSSVQPADPPREPVAECVYVLAQDLPEPEHPRHLLARQRQRPRPFDSQHNLQHSPRGQR